MLEGERVLLRPVSEADIPRLREINNEASVARWWGEDEVMSRPVGVMRRYERDPATGEWADGLLMDLLADELTE